MLQKMLFGDSIINTVRAVILIRASPINIPVIHTLLISFKYGKLLKRVLRIDNEQSGNWKLALFGLKLYHKTKFKNSSL